MSALPTGLRTNCWFSEPTLKRGANYHSAYGAGDRLMPICRAFTQAALKGDYRPVSKSVVKLTRQKQILRLTTPKLKNVWGPVPS
jgi:hypothetical protein